MPEDPTTPLPPAPPARRCTRCYYVIDHLERVGKCPECGLSYHFDDPYTYTTNPPFVRWIFWLPGLITALVCALILEAILIPSVGYGWATTLLVPIVAGVILGYSNQLKNIFGRLAIAVCLTCGLALGLVSMSLAGAFCGLVLGVLAIVPVLAGVGVGALVRGRLKSSEFSQRVYLPTILIGTVLIAFAEGRHDQLAIVSTSTSMVIAASPDKAWEAIQFYEEVNHRTPWLLRITPTFRPMYTTGSSTDVGDIKVCVYERGRLVKQVTEIVPGKHLAFRVIEQTDIQNRGVRLIDGSFDLVPSADGRSTTVTLTTRYEPHLAPRFAFLPAEDLAVHTLHSHVLRGMKEKGEQQ